MEYKKCECLKCGNIFLSKRYAPRCVKGTLNGCNSTLVNVLEVKQIERQIKIKTIENKSNEDVLILENKSNEDVLIHIKEKEINLEPKQKVSFLDMEF